MGLERGGDLPHGRKMPEIEWGDRVSQASIDGTWVRQVDVEIIADIALDGNCPTCGREGPHLHAFMWKGKQ